MRAKPKIAYLMHVEWDWIKQRPHFLYEELTRYFTVDVFYIKKMYGNDSGKNRNERNIHSASKARIFKKLPVSGRFKGLRRVERLLNREVIHSLYEYNYIWITSPLLLDFIFLEQLKEQSIIYDCMDDFLGFYSDFRGIDRLRELETRLVKRADRIITSSIYLRGKLLNSYMQHMNSDPIVVNNGISERLIQGNGMSIISNLKVKVNKQELFNFMYIGTIGKWLDFDLILRALDLFPNCQFTLVGPVETKTPSHPRIKFEGAVRHDQLTDLASSADALVMPFTISELVRAVDPVKIYEYIFFDKPIIAVDYEEMHKFSPFVNLYSSKAGFIELMNKVIEGKLTVQPQEEALDFLQKNTWFQRGQHIVKILEGDYQ